MSVSTILQTFRMRVDDCRLRTAIGRAGRSSRLPLFDLGGKLIARHRNRVPTFPRIPTPGYQFVLSEVLYELIEIAVPVLFGVLN